jgi:biopolymer transport protein ExbD
MLFRSKNSSPELDMNPMVDMAFLLVSFFMLTTTFKTVEPVSVQKPSSTSEIKIPERNLMKITINKNGKVFFGIDNKFVRRSLLNKMSMLKGVDFKESERDVFSLLSGIGVPFQELPVYLELTTEEQKQYVSTGIPCNSKSNELKDWILSSRLVNPAQRVAVIADEDTPYEYIRCVINTLKELKIYRFNIVTDLE